MPPVPPNVFLSYSHLDRSTVKTIRQILVDNGINIRWDHEFTIGERWETQMQRNLKEADCVVIVWSENSAKSEVVQHEFTIADYENKQIGIALHPGIDFKAIGGSPHHERYYEWDDDNRDARIKAVIDRIREIAEKRNPKVSMQEILSLVRRVDRVPQARKVLKTAKEKLTTDHPGCIWLVSANRFERPEEFVTRAANQLIPRQLKRRGIISDANDESYELELYKLKWPEGYGDVDEGVEVIVEQLQKKVIDDEDEESSSLGQCIAATSTIAPTLYLELHLDAWQSSDKTLLEKLIEIVGKLPFDPADPKYLTIFIAAEFDHEGDRKVATASGSLLGRIFAGTDDIDDVFAALAGQSGCSVALPTMTKIARSHVADWYDAVNEHLSIPAEQQNYFLKKINEPFMRNDSQAEHYQAVAEPMQKALQRVFHGRVDD